SNFIFYLTVVKLVPGGVYCCDCHHKVMAETKKKQKCNINIAKITEKTVIKLKAAITMKFRWLLF
ncbi:hypothetical protein, partial [Salmonella enterica]